jgi:hypothetical protein
LLKRIVIIVAALAALSAVLLGVKGLCVKRSLHSASLAPTLEDLEQAYRSPDERLGGHQRGRAVLVDSGGITILCGANPKGEGEHTWLIQLEDDGSLRWQRHYPPSEGSGEAISAVKGGGFIIAGAVQRGAMEFQAHLLRVAADGSVVAGGALGPRGVNGFDAVAVLPDESLVAGGTSSWKGWLVRTDGALRTSWELPLDDAQGVKSLVPLADGGFAAVVTQDKSTTELGRARLTAFAGDGRVRWQTLLPTTGRGELAALVALPDGGLAAVGHRVADERDARRLWVVRMAAGGQVLWERVLGPSDEERRGSALVALPDGGFAVVGDALRRDGRRGLRAARLSAEGAVVWERSYGGERSDEALGLARSEDGGLVLVGSTASKGEGKTNVWILRLDSQGQIRWEQVFGSAG